MGTSGPHSQFVASNRVFALSALAGAIAATLIGCGGGAAGTVNTSECGPSELTKAGGGCTPVKLVDTNGDNNADGIDVSGDNIPEMVFVAGGPSTKGLDLNGDSNADYFLQMTDNKLRVFGTADASGVLVTVVVSPSGELIGLDSTGDLVSDDNRLSDKVAPSIQATPNGGTLLRAPNVALECSDNVACNAIAYTLDGSEPVFASGSTVVTGRTANVQMTANTAVTLKFRARDAAGNLGEVKTAAFTLGCPTPGQLPNAAGGCVNPTQVDITRDSTPDGFDFDGNGVPEVLFLGGTPRGLDLDGDGVANYYWATGGSGLWSMSIQADGTGPVRVVTGDSQTAIGFDTNDDGTSDNNLLVDVAADTATPTIAVSPGGGNYATAQIVTLTCSDGVACDAISYTLDGSEPNFVSNGAVIPGAKATIQLALNATPRVRAVARDSKGNASTIADASYRIGCPSNPIARAGADLELSIDESAQFNGSGSFTSNGSIASYRWTQLAAGNAPTMNNGQPFIAAMPQFTAPANITTLRYQLEVTDSNNCKATDEVLAYVVRDKTRAVFVNGDAGNDTTGDGSRAKPWATLSKGVANAGSDPAGTKDVYAVSRAGNADYVEPAILAVPAGVSLFGGFDSQWIRDPENNRTSLQSAAPTAVSVTVGTKPSFVAGFNIKTAASSSNSSTDTFALRVVGISTTGTNFTSRHNTLKAGHVGDGLTGVATPGSSYGLHVSTVETVTVEDSQVTSGKGGKGVVGSAGAAGKNGNKGGDADGAKAGVSGASPDTALAIAGGAGGGGGGGGGGLLAGGAAGTIGRETGVLNDGKAGLPAPASAIGGAGQDGKPGGGGDPGKPAAQAVSGLGGLTGAGIYQTASGSPGTRGGHGGGAGGAAGGGGGTTSGGGGGGGGSGGTGGGAGLGGIGGGASVGLLLDKVKTASIAQQTTIASAEGGSAGAGGHGGAGSIGGAGGGGSTPVGLAGKGGTGGKGGDGGAGGDASGGGGGPSIGIFVGAGVAATIDSTVTVTTGNGGTGGGTRNSKGGQGGHVYGVFDADPAGPNPVVVNPGAITLGVGGTGGAKETGGTGAAGAVGLAKPTNW